METSPSQEPAEDLQDIDSDVESVLADWDPVGFDAQDFDDIMSVPEQVGTPEPMDIDDQGIIVVKEQVSFESATNSNQFLGENVDPFDIDIPYSSNPFTPGEIHGIRYLKACRRNDISINASDEIRDVFNEALRETGGKMIVG